MFADGCFLMAALNRSSQTAQTALAWKNPLTWLSCVITLPKRTVKNGALLAPTHQTISDHHHEIEAFYTARDHAQAVTVDSWKRSLIKSVLTHRTAKKCAWSHWFLGKGRWKEPQGDLPNAKVMQLWSSLETDRESVLIHILSLYHIMYEQSLWRELLY